MNSLQILAIAICLALSLPGAAQRTQPVTPPPQTMADPGERVHLIVRDILEAGGYPTLAIRLREDRAVRNAMATLEGRERYIKYNPDFVAKFERDAQTQYATYALFAHEIGHHALNHDFLERDCGKRKKMELEADAFAGRVLNMLCITLEDATAGFRSMDQDVSAGCYPPPSVREASASNGWLERDAYFRKIGQHPCETQVPFPLRLGDRMRFNRSQNVQAVIKGNRMEIRYDLPKDISKFNVFFGVDPTAPLTPRSLDWIGDSTQPGPGRILIWYFTEDGYTRAQVEKKSEWLGIVAYAPDRVPKPLSGGLRALQIGGVVAGAGLLGYGIALKLDACDLYKTYKNNRDPDAQIYTDPGKLSRPETFKKANRENKWALGCMVVGTAVTGLSTWWLVKRSQSNKRFKAAHFYTAAPEDFELEGLSLVGSSGRPGVGIYARF